MTAEPTGTAEPQEPETTLPSAKIAPAPSLEKQELLKLYELSVQEYRFQVQLNWDRSKHMLVIDGVLLGAAATLYKLQPGQTPPPIVGVIFLLAAIVSALGFFGVRRGHSYYRETRGLKEKFEARLGLDALGLALRTTPGMNQSPPVPAGRWTKLAAWAGKLTVHLQAIFAVAGALSLAAAIYVLVA